MALRSRGRRARRTHSCRSPSRPPTPPSPPRSAPRPDTSGAAELGSETGAWTTQEIVGVSVQSSGAACGGAQRTLHLRNAVVFSALPLVRVTRRRRYMLYRGSDGLWWLGERTCG